MNEAREAIPDRLKIGDWQFHVMSHELEGGGKKIRLEPRVAKLLQYLATHAGETISRGALLGALWPDVVVTDEALTNAVNKLRRAFGDDRAKPQVIETIPKAGYRLIASVQPIMPVSAHPVTETCQKDARGHTRPYRLFLVAGLALVLSAGLVVWFVTTVLPTEKELARDGLISWNDPYVESYRPALAVLPFDNLGNEPAQEYFADGITDDVITRLAKNSALMVISRDSTFFYKGKSMDPHIIAEDLDVDYVLRGSIRREGNVLKVNVWLIDVETGSHVWAEHFDRKTEDIFEIQKEIARGINTALISTGTDHLDTSRTTDNPEAYDSLLLGRHHFYKFESHAQNLKARAYFEEATRFDPGFAIAYAMLAWTYVFDAMNGWTDDRPAALQKAEHLATLAIEFQPRLPLGYYVRGLSFREQQEYVKALVEAQMAIKYDPNYANGHVLLATLLYYAGRPEEGLINIQRAMQINPHHPYNYHFHLGQAYFVLHRHDEAIDAFNEGLSSNPASERMRVWLAAALAHSGDIESARWEAEQIISNNANFSIQRMAQAFPFKNPADLEHFLNGLRLAGLH